MNDRFRKQYTSSTEKAINSENALSKKYKKNANADAEADKPNGTDIVRLCLSKRNSDCEKENDVEGRSWTEKVKKGSPLSVKKSNKEIEKVLIFVVHNSYLVSCNNSAKWIYNPSLSIIVKKLWLALLISVNHVDR